MTLTPFALGFKPILLSYLILLCKVIPADDELLHYFVNVLEENGVG